MNGNKPEPVVAVEAYDPDPDLDADCPCVDELVAFDSRVSLYRSTPGGGRSNPDVGEALNRRIVRVT